MVSANPAVHHRSQMEKNHKPGISNMLFGQSSSSMYKAYAASYTIKEPFLRAASTKLVSCALVAAAPVGLLGEQKKMTSDFAACNTTGE